MGPVLTRNILACKSPTIYQDPQNMSASKGEKKQSADVDLEPINRFQLINATIVRWCGHMVLHQRRQQRGVGSCNREVSNIN
jgi:hypothetical protein